MTCTFARMEDEADEELEGEPDALLPPYLPYRSFRTGVERLATSGRLPPRIDRSVLKTMPGGTQGHFLAALKSLGLIDKEAAPTEPFRSLVAEKSARWNEVMPAIMQARYSKAALAALANGTPSQVVEAMGQGSKGTNAKSALFFVMAALDASMPVSPHLLDSKGKPLGFARGKPKPKPRKPAASPTESASAAASAGATPLDPSMLSQAIPMGPDRYAELRWPADITLDEIDELHDGLTAFKTFMQFQVKARERSRAKPSEAKDGAS